MTKNYIASWIRKTLHPYSTRQKKLIENAVRKHYQTIYFLAQVYFEQAFNEKYYHAVFYGLPKIHK